MKIGFVGLGKLGLPVALAVESKGHEVIGYDTSPNVRSIITNKLLPYREELAQPLLKSSRLQFSSLPEVVAKSDIIFMPVQTPHDPMFEGDKRIPEDRADFNYSWLLQAIRSVAAEAARVQKKVTLVVISTCLPGTYTKFIKPELNEWVDYVYNPFFIAMGTTIADFTHPEFVLVGQESTVAVDKLREFYGTIHERPLFVTDITTAEGVKVFYNTFITMKTVLANTYGEMSHRLGMNVDDIFEALSMADQRIISPKYLRAGMGDGGGCHPRDNIALSHIARESGMSHNIFEDLMAAREDHTEWLASLVRDAHCASSLPIILLGRPFKPETNIETGSPSVLLSNILSEWGLAHQHVNSHSLDYPAVYFIGTQNDLYKTYLFPANSIVIDPFGYIADQPGVEVTRIGRP